MRLFVKQEKWTKVTFNMKQMEYFIRQYSNCIEINKIKNTQGQWPWIAYFEERNMKSPIRTNFLIWDPNITLTLIWIWAAEKWEWNLSISQLHKQSWKEGLQECLLRVQARLLVCYDESMHWKEWTLQFFEFWHAYFLKRN